jgi:redox-sensitive bicupin YhaK (pirin superfamily)
MLGPVTAAHPKSVEAIVLPPARHWVGDGFPVRTMFSYDRDAALWSPFLLLDYAAPMRFQPTVDRRGVGEHPHRGFETVTIAYQGEVEHRDSAGHAGRIGPGDVQWMTAASGVLHEEFHGAGFARTGGPFEMAQIWVNLPAASKMSAPRYQDLPAARFPTAPLPGGAGTARVIAGELLGARGPARTFTPVLMADVALAAGAKVDLPLPEGHVAILLVRRGEVRLAGGASLPEASVARLSRAGRDVHVESAEPAELLLLGGAPIDEPVVGHGPFVMNTRAEIATAIEDYQAGRMGTLA